VYAEKDKKQALHVLVFKMHILSHASHSNNMRMCFSKRTPAVPRDLFVLKNRRKVGTGMFLTTKGINLKMITWNDSSLILKPTV